MDPWLFGKGSTGKLVEISYPGATHAFVPDELPPNWSIPIRLWPLVVEARAAISSLNGTGKLLPNPQLLLTPLQYREAQLSSKLEGTIVHPQQLMLFEMDPSPEVADDAVKEVSNYMKALSYYTGHKDELPLSLRLIRRLHEVLLRNVRGEGRNPGEFRRVQVQIDKPARFVPPPANYVPPLLWNLELFIHSEGLQDPLVDAFVVHYQLEAIHPFRDGNGRIGRLLLALMISEKCRLDHNWLYMSPFFDANKNEYIDRLFCVSTEGDWTAWIEFCLNGVISQAKDTEKRCDRLLKIYDDFKERIHNTGGSHRLNRIAEDLFVTPVVQIPSIADKFSVTYHTARSDVERLIKAGVLTELPGQQIRTFISSEIFDVIFEPIDSLLS